MRISDWSSDVCSSDLRAGVAREHAQQSHQGVERVERAAFQFRHRRDHVAAGGGDRRIAAAGMAKQQAVEREGPGVGIVGRRIQARRSEEHTSELQSLMRISYAVFCLKKKKKTTYIDTAQRN